MLSQPQVDQQCCPFRFTQFYYEGRLQTFQYFLPCLWKFLMPSLRSRNVVIPANDSAHCLLTISVHDIWSIHMAEYTR